MLPLLLFSAAFTWTIHLPTVPFQRGQHHIHSPEFFLPAYGLCGPRFELLEATPPVVGRYHLVELAFRSLWGKARVRVFSSCPNRSHFFIYGEEPEPDTMGSLCAEADAHGGLVLRGGVWPLIPDYDRLLSWRRVLRAPRVCPRAIEAAIYNGCVAQHEEPHLLRYRRLVLHHQQHQL